MCVCVCVCVHACVRACVSARVRACVRACVCVCVGGGILSSKAAKWWNLKSTREVTAAVFSRKRFNTVASLRPTLFPRHNSTVQISVWQPKGCVCCCQFTFDRSTLILLSVIIFMKITIKNLVYLFIQTKFPLSLSRSAPTASREHKSSIC